MNTEKFKKQIKARLAELQDRLENVERTCGERTEWKSKNQARELQDDEVLKAVGCSGEIEMRLLHEALRRLENGSFLKTQGIR